MRDWKEWKTEGQYGQWCLIGTNTCFLKKVIIEFMREKTQP